MFLAKCGLLLLVHCLGGFKKLPAILFGPEVVLCKVLLTTILLCSCVRMEERPDIKDQMLFFNFLLFLALLLLNLSLVELVGVGVGVGDGRCVVLVVVVVDDDVVLDVVVVHVVVDVAVTVLYISCVLTYFLQRLARA